MYDAGDYWAVAWRAALIVTGAIAVIGIGWLKTYEAGAQAGVKAGYQRGIMQCPRAQKGTYDFDHALMDTGHTGT